MLQLTTPEKHTFLQMHQQQDYSKSITNKK
jgi:hypothetical protein